MSLSWKRLATEAIPVAAILLFWNVLSAIAAMQEVGGPVRTAGTVMAALYVLLRGIALASEATAFRMEKFKPLLREDVEALLYENARVAAPAGIWFLGGLALSIPYTPFDLLGALASAFMGAGLGVVTLYAVATGTATLRGPDVARTTPDATTNDESADDASSADD